MHTHAPVELVCALRASLLTSYRKWPSIYQRTYSPGDQSCGVVAGGRMSAPSQAARSGVCRQAGKSQALLPQARPLTRPKVW